MCGIAGIFSLEPVEEEIVARMLEAIAYRGPDHCEVHRYQSPSGAHLTLGQARLAIIDLSPEANQPFDNSTGETSLTFNGEFYNFQDLKKELETSGPPFCTRSDTEVALRALDRWGVEALPRLWGMFAGAWFDRKAGRLLLFRDRLGQKPLYIYTHGKRLYFASEPKAILRVLDHMPEPDDRALAHYFYLGYIPSESCVFQGMSKLAAGHVLTIDAAFEPQTQRWYRPEREQAPPEEDLESLFMDAVSKRMISDVPLAAFLSGGLDSSLVVAAMSRMSTLPVNTFSVRFDGTQVLDESKYARLVAKHCNTHHHEIVLDLHKLMEAMPRVLDHFDEPFGDASAVPTLLVSEAARQQFTVALSGDGADEVFAGYRKYLGPYFLGKLGPYFLRRYFWKPLSRLFPTGRTSRRLELGRRIRRLLRGDAPTAAQRHVNWLLMSPVDETTLLGPRLKDRAVKTGLTDRLPPDADLNDVLRFDQDLVLQDDMFVKVDRMSMKASLEVRSPFVDHRIVQLANQLPPHRKLEGTRRKAVLCDRLGHLLPPEILNRPKTGFEMPTGAWLKGDLRSWSEHRLFHHYDTTPWVDHANLRRLWDIHCSGKQDCTEPIWFHIVFASWLKGMYS